MFFWLVYCLLLSIFVFRKQFKQDQGQIILEIAFIAWLLFFRPAIALAIRFILLILIGIIAALIYGGIYVFSCWKTQEEVENQIDEIGLRRNNIQELVTLVLIKNTIPFIPNERDDVEICVICQTNFEAEENVVQLTCDNKHIFHQQCLEGWALTKMECPICRKSIEPAKSGQFSGISIEPPRRPSEAEMNPYQGPDMSNRNVDVERPQVVFEQHSEEQWTDENEIINRGSCVALSDIQVEEEKSPYEQMDDNNYDNRTLVKSRKHQL